VAVVVDAGAAHAAGGVEGAALRVAEVMGFGADRVAAELS
jgi:hypothetical protein